MKLSTAAAVISFAKKLEEDGAKFYEELAERYTEDGEILLSLAKENKRNIVQIERTYYGVITDAIEGCFAFDINPEEYMFRTDLVQDISYADNLSKAVEMEDKVIKFYSDAAEQSKSLLADVPRVFTMVAKKRDNRRSKLKALIYEEG